MQEKHMVHELLGKTEDPTKDNTRCGQDGNTMDEPRSQTYAVGDLEPGNALYMVHNFPNLHALQESKANC